tara:strand:+ start:708 stop:1856 length:1149 start_codon:yes stop_codon:yes gene_type:complete
MMKERISRNVLSFGPRFTWRNMVGLLRQSDKDMVSLAILSKDNTATVNVNDLRVVLLATSKTQNRATVCRPVLDAAGDVRIGGAPIYTVDNRCPPKGKAQAYRSVKKDPNRVINKTVFGKDIEVTDNTLDSNISGDFYIRVVGGFVQLVVGTFRPFDKDGKREETTLPDIAYSFPIEAIVGDNPAIVLNVDDANLVEKIVEANNDSSTLLPKKLKIAPIERGTTLAILHSPVEVSVGQPFYDEFPGDSKNADRVADRRPETAVETVVINKMMANHVRGAMGDPSDWAFNILFKTPDSDELVTYQKVLEDNIGVEGDENGSPLMFMDCSNLADYWVKAKDGYVALLPPMPMTESLIMNNIVIEFTSLPEMAPQKITPIKPVTA